MYDKVEHYILYGVIRGHFTFEKVTGNELHLVSAHSDLFSILPPFLVNLPPPSPLQT